MRIIPFCSLIYPAIHGVSYSPTRTSAILFRWSLHTVPSALVSGYENTRTMSLFHRRLRDQHDMNVAESSGSPTTNPERIDQQQHSSKVPRRRSSGLKVFASSATPKAEASKDSHKAWEAGYLKDLRANRPARPGGSRPLPGRAATFTPEPYVRTSSAVSSRPDPSIRQPDLASASVKERSVSALSHRRAQSQMPGNHEDIGRPMVREPITGVRSQDLSASMVVPQAPSMLPSGTYREGGMRWMEKQEARSLREALEDMDLRDEAKVHAAAQDEASELVWTHRKKDATLENPYQPYNYKKHLEKGAHARSQSHGRFVMPDAASNDQTLGQPSFSDHSASVNVIEASSPKSRKPSIVAEDTAKASHTRSISGQTGHELWDSLEKKAYMNLTSTVLPPVTSGRRRSSGPRARDVSGGLFRNPDDKIFEEPDDSQKSPMPSQSEHSRLPVPLRTKHRNAISKIPTSSQPFTGLTTEDKQRLYRSEIHRNPPSQSRNPSYLKNKRSLEPHDDPEPIEPVADLDTQQMLDGKEIRSDDIRAATSMRLKDRSPKLPSPTVVSDRPGRPIVSFSHDWKPKGTDIRRDSSPTRPSGVPPRMRSKPQMPPSTASAPIIPTINVPNPPSIFVKDAPTEEAPSIPSIAISECSTPTISLPYDPPAARPLPAPSSRHRPVPATRPLPHHSATTPVISSRLHWSPSSRRATAQCAACALPIEGRIVSAASQRFHPHCFTCHHCAEALECVAFYPEPDTARNARLARIDARADGTSVVPEEEEKPGETALDDGDPSLRFYCHLDFHELYSPRCRSCKTPIETEVVIACGASWHVGHFFCAQCGDPFDAKTPFVEKDGYAWCVGCHAGRFSGKCKGCKKPVVDGAVVALGEEWHVGCFCCVVSVSLFFSGKSVFEGLMSWF